MQRPCGMGEHDTFKEMKGFCDKSSEGIDEFPNSSCKSLAYYSYLIKNTDLDGQMIGGTTRYMEVDQ